MNYGHLQRFAGILAAILAAILDLQFIWLASKNCFGQIWFLNP